MREYSIVGAPLRCHKSTIKPSGNIRISYQFETVCLQFCTLLHAKWYKLVNGKILKVIPYNHFQLLTPRALAFWLAGDASFHKSEGYIHISTDSFTAAEVDFLRSVLLYKYSIESKRYAHNKAKEQ